MAHRPLTLVVLEGTYAICRFAPDTPMPAWGTTVAFSSITRTTDELSVVCRQDAVPDGVQCEKYWRCLRVAGAIDFSMTGVLSSIVTPLAEAGITVFAMSTFDTDYVLMKQEDFDRTMEVWRNSGHSVT